MEIPKAVIRDGNTPGQMTLAVMQRCERSCQQQSVTWRCALPTGPSVDAWVLVKWIAAAFDVLSIDDVNIPIPKQSASHAHDQSPWPDSLSDVPSAFASRPATPERA
jgi:hypothetical protein